MSDKPTLKLTRLAVFEEWVVAWTTAERLPYRDRAEFSSGSLPYGILSESSAIPGYYVVTPASGSSLPGQITIHRDGIFVCRERDWDNVVQIVEAINGDPPAAPKLADACQELLAMYATIGLPTKHVRLAATFKELATEYLRRHGLPVPGEG